MNTKADDTIGHNRSITDFANERQKEKVIELKLAAFIANHCSMNTADQLGSLVTTFCPKLASCSAKNIKVIIVIYLFNNSYY